MQSNYQASFVQHPVDVQALRQAHEHKTELRKSHFIFSCAPQEPLSSTMRSDIGVFKAEPKQVSASRHGKTSIEFGNGVPTEAIQSDSRANFTKHAPSTRSPMKPTGASISFGFFDREYKSTSACALEAGRSDPSARPGVLAASVKADLRKAHFDLGGAHAGGWTTTTQDMLQPHGFCRVELDPEMKKDLQASHFSADSSGDATHRRVSVSHASFAWPA